MTRIVFFAAFFLGLCSVTWMSSVFVHGDLLALTVTLLIGGVFILGAVELWQFRRTTAGLTAVTHATREPVEQVQAWLSRLPEGLHYAVQQRIAGERVGLPTPVLTPYLVGLLVMLGLLGTFVGMVETLQGAVAALRESAELEAIRAGLTAPIQGLGMAFGTSVAGVAASAMLGLMSTLSRRERMQASRQLDRVIATHLHHHSLQHKRDLTYTAIQNQAEALPDVASKMTAVAEQLAQMSDALNDKLTAKHEMLSVAMAERYTQLTDSVASALHTSMAENGRVLNATLTPVVAELSETMRSELSASAQATQQVLNDTAQAQVAALQQHFGATATQVSEAWQQGLRAQQDQSQSLLDEVQQMIAALQSEWASTQNQLHAALRDTTSAFIDQQTQADQARRAASEAQLQQNREATASALNALITQFGDQQRALQQEQAAALTSSVESFKQLAADINAQWSDAESRAQAHHDAQTQSLQRTVETIQTQTTQHAEAQLAQHARLFKQSEQLVAERQQAEQVWLDDYRSRMSEISEQHQTHLQALREGEQAQGEAAVARLGELQAAVAEQLATLGQALEDPMARLIATASEAPRAAAELIAQLRDEMSKNMARDNGLLEERKQTLADLNALTQALTTHVATQGETIEQLVQQSGSLLASFSDRVGQEVDTGLGKLTQVADHFATSSADMASLGEAFGVAVMSFGETNQQLLSGLSNIEQSLEQSALRSDEQLAYYVAQARDIIDYSIRAQKELLSHMQAPEAATAEEVS